MDGATLDDGTIEGRAKGVPETFPFMEDHKRRRLQPIANLHQGIRRRCGWVVDLGCVTIG